MADFWTIIEETRTAPESQGNADPDRLQLRLEALPTEEVRAFAEEFARHHEALNTWTIWGAGYVIAGGMSDDGFHYFKSWIIGRGRETYEEALRDPESLGDLVSDPEEVDNEGLAYPAAEILESQGVEAPEIAESESTRGEPFDEETVERQYPRLAAKFG